MKLSAKRILALMMALCLCLGLCSFSAKAEFGDEAIRQDMPILSGDPLDDIPQPIPDGIGTIYLTRSLANAGDGTYNVTYTAKTTMIEWLAQAAAVCRANEHMACLRFTCTLSDELTKNLSNDSIPNFDFNSATFKVNEVEKPIFVPLNEATDGQKAVSIKGEELKLRYKLNPEILGNDSSDTGTWCDPLVTLDSVKSALRQQMEMSAIKTGIRESDIPGNTNFTTTARIDIETTDSVIPFYRVETIPAAKGSYTPDNGGGGGGGGGGGTGGGGGGTTTDPTDPTNPTDPTKPPIEIKDNTTIDNAGGTIEVDKPNAKPGETVKITTHSNKGSMIDHIKVTGADSSRVALSYEGEGKFTFVVPEGGDVVIETVFRTIPADPDETGVSELLDTDNHRLYLIGDEKGDFRPDASITRAEIATAFFRLLRNQDVERTEHFADVEESKWYVQPIEVLASLGIIEGVGDGVFEPDRAITRAEFAAVAARFAKKLFSGTAFNDVSEEAWYADFVSTAAHYGWINGVGDGAYEPDRDITRTEAAAIINRMLLRISDWIDVDAGHGRHFPDVSEDFWGKYEISEATNNHDHTLEDEYFFEDWHDEDWRETVDNDPVNFGQPN